MSNSPKDTVSKGSKKKTSPSFDTLKRFNAITSSPDHVLNEYGLLSQSASSFLVNPNSSSTSSPVMLRSLAAASKLAPSTTIHTLTSWSDSLDKVSDNNSSFTVLDLEREEFPSDFVHSLSGVLKYNTHLVELNLSHHLIGDYGAKTLSLGLRPNHTLKKLNLANCGIGSLGGQAICDLLIISKGITSLNLQGNTGLADVGPRFAEVIKTNKILIELNVMECDFTAAPWKEALKSNNTLIKLEAGMSLPSCDVTSSTLQTAKTVIASANHKVGPPKQSLSGPAGFNFFNSLSSLTGNNSSNTSSNLMDLVPLTNEPNSECQLMVSTNRVLAGIASFLEENRGQEAFVVQLRRKHPTILIDSCRRGHFAAVHRLLELGIDPNESIGATPSRPLSPRSATSQKDIDSSKLTKSESLSLPIPQTQKDSSDKGSPNSSPFNYPPTLGHSVSSSSLNLSQIKTADNKSNSDQLLSPFDSHNFPIYEAIQHGNLNVVKLLISYGAIVSDELVDTIAPGYISKLTSVQSSTPQSVQAFGKEMMRVLKEAQEGIIDLSEGAYKLFGPSSLQNRVGIRGVKLGNNCLGPTFPSLLMTRLLQIGSELTYLNLTGNQLQSIPSQIGDLANLQTLNLSDNQLETLPASLANLNHLKVLEVKKNPLSLLPEEVVKKGTARILQYLREITVPTHSWSRLKLLVVGRENVGKTHLIRRLQKREYMQNISTDGLEISDVPISKKVDFCIFDFAGQQVFYPTHMFFLSEKAVYTVVFSATDEESFRIVEYWLKVIRALAAGTTHTPVVLVATHMDDPQAMNFIPELKDRVKKLRQSYRTIVKDVFYISNKSGEGFRELRAKLLELALNHKIITTPVPESYVLLEKLILKEKANKRPLLLWPEFRTIAKNAHVYDDVTLRACTQFLHDVGSIIWFNQPELRDLVILDPQWLADVMASVISFKANWKSGLLVHDSLPIIWKQYPSSLHKTLLGILEKFEVLFPIRAGEGASIVPTMLPESPSEAFGAFSCLRLPPTEFRRIERTYKFGFMPIGFFSRLIARLFLSPTLFCHEPWLRGVMISPPSILNGIDYEFDEQGLLTAKASSTPNLLQKSTDLLLGSPKNIYKNKVHITAEEKLTYLQQYATSTALKRGFEQASISYFESQQTSILNIVVWKPIANEEEQIKTKDNLMMHIIDALEELLATHYKKYDDSIERIIVHAQSTNPSAITEVTLPDMLSFLSYGHTTLNCKGEVVALDEIAPDICFADVHRFSDVVIERELGEGGVGLIFLANVPTDEITVGSDGSGVPSLNIADLSGSEPISPSMSASSSLSSIPEIGTPSKYPMQPIHEEPEPSLETKTASKTSTESEPEAHHQTASETSDVLQDQSNKLSTSSDTAEVLQEPSVKHSTPPQPRLRKSENIKLIRTESVSESELSSSQSIKSESSPSKVAEKKATDSKDARTQVAIKRLKVTPGMEAQRFREFAHEVRLMASLNHPCIVRLYGVQLSPLGMVMEYVSGKDLWTVLHNPNISDEVLSWRVRAKLALDIARGMRHLQSQVPPIVHRDLRSPNIFVMGLDENLEVMAKVADFGLSMKVLSNLSDVLQTWQWLAPEVIDLNQCSYDESSDVYSFGIVLWEICTRKFPFSEYTAYINRETFEISEEQAKDPNLFSNLKADGWEIDGHRAVRETYNRQKFVDLILKENLRPTIPSKVPPAMAKLIDMCWQREPSQRPTFQKIVAALANMLGTDKSKRWTTRFNLSKPTSPTQPSSRRGSLSSSDPNIPIIRPNSVSPQPSSEPQSLSPRKRYSIDSNDSTGETAQKSLPQPTTPVAIPAARKLQNKKASHSLNSTLSFLHRTQTGVADHGLEVSDLVWENLVSTPGEPTDSPRSLQQTFEDSPRLTSSTNALSLHSTNLSSQIAGVSATTTKAPVILTRTLDEKLTGSAMIIIQVDEAHVWIGQQDGYISVYENTSPPKFVTSFQAHKKEIFTMAVVGQDVWVGSGDATISIWTIKKYKQKKVIKDHLKHVRCILNIPSVGKSASSYVISGDTDGNVIIWKNMNIVHKFVVESNQPINSMVYVDSSRHLWIGTYRKIFIYSVQDWSCVTEIPAHEGIINAMVTSGDTLWSCCSNTNSLACWDTHALVNKMTIKGTPRITSLALANHPVYRNEYLWVGTLEKVIYLYNTSNGELIEALKGHTDYIYTLCKLFNDSSVWSAGRDCVVRTWNY